MSLPKKSTFRLIATLAVIASSLSVTEAASAAAAELAPLRAPFECGTEWAGTTRSGHGLNDWNLDINSTARTYDDRNHDLGAPLLAQADGTIVWIGTHPSAGTYVEIDYGDTTVVYVHLVDDSVPDGLEVGSPVVEGQQFAELGGTGNASHAHLHLEYFDSRAHPDSRSWPLPDANQVQIAFDGVIVGPGDVFVSTNCDGAVPVASVPMFVDVDADSFAYDDIGLLYELAITQGTGNGAYSPDQTVDREQMAAFLARIWRLFSPDTPVPDGDYPFDDVDPSSFAYDDIKLIFSLGITTGTGQTTYSPDREVSREQMAAFLNRIHELLEDSGTAGTPDTGLEPASGEVVNPALPTYPFVDVDSVSFAYDDIARIYRLGITRGTSASTYSPAEVVDREQMAAFLARVYRLVSDAETPAAS